MKTLIKIGCIILLITFTLLSMRSDSTFYEWGWCTFGITLNEDVTIYTKTKIEDGPIVYSDPFSVTNAGTGVQYIPVEFYGEQGTVDGWCEMYVVGETLYTEWKRKDFYNTSLAGVRFDSDDWMALYEPGS